MTGLGLTTNRYGLHEGQKPNRVSDLRRQHDPITVTDSWSERAVLLDVVLHVQLSALTSFISFYAAALVAGQYELKSRIARFARAPGRV